MPPKNRSSGSRSGSPAATGEIKESGAVVSSDELPSNFESSMRSFRDEIDSRMSDMHQTTLALISKVSEESDRRFNALAALIERRDADRTPLREGRSYSPRKPRRELPKKEPVYWFDPLPPTSPVEQEVYLSEFDSDQEVARLTRPTPKPARLSLVNGLEAIQKRKMAGSTVQYYEQAPKPNFKLDTLKYSEVHAFVLSFTLHMLRYPTAPVQLQLLIDRRVQAHIMSTCMIMREDDFYAMNNTEVLKCIQRTISPKNKKKFWNILNVQFVLILMQTFSWMLSTL